MKVEYKSDKVIIYLTYKKININDTKILGQEIKKIIIYLIKKYNMDFYGYSKVTIYNNQYYGNVLEIEKIYNNEFNNSIIDLKIIVLKNVSMYLEFDDYYFDQKRVDFTIKNGKYYLNINENIDIMKYIEYAKINYSNNS